MLTRDHRGPHERRLRRQRGLQLRQQLLRPDEAQLAQALCHDVPGSLLRALAVLEQLLPRGHDVGGERAALAAARGDALGGDDLEERENNGLLSGLVISRCLHKMVIQGHT